MSSGRRGGRRLAPHEEGAGPDAVPTGGPGAPGAPWARGRGPSPGGPSPPLPPLPRPWPPQPCWLARGRSGTRHRARPDRQPPAGTMGCDVRVSGLLRRNLQPTLTYWSVFFSFGLCIAFLGPTLLDLRCQTHSSLPQISWVFFSQQLCLLLGSALGGVFKRT